MLLEDLYMNLFCNKKIPNCPMPTGDTLNSFVDESLVELSQYFGGEIQIEAVYYNQRILGATKQCFVRLSVAKKLERAIKLLPNNLTFKVFDAWRPLCVQEQLYNNYYRKIQSEHKDWDNTKIESEIVKFVSKPNYNTKKPAVHSTGGAIDLTIVYRDSGKMLDMGTLFDDFTHRSCTNFFEKSDNNEVKINRRLLYWTMLKSGFTNLPSEWWHYDYGDRFWSYYKNKPALYCGILGENIYE